jgi:dephospho-CoA kinase
MAKPVVGLIGGMGSGKSLVANVFAEHGARIISGDELGHEALRQAEIRAQLVQRWGKEVLDAMGAVDRRRVAAIVFADARERQALEAMVFPWIKRRIEEEITKTQADPNVALIVLDAAIMLETGWSKVCDRLLFVDAPRKARLRRLAEQRGWSPAEVEARERAQMPLGEKRQRANVVLDNSGSPEQLRVQVHALLRQWGIGCADHGRTDC